MQQRRLRRLDLSHNQLNTLSPTIGNLINLQELNLNYNKLTALPSEIGNLTSLRTLSLVLNKLTDLPITASKLTNLRELDLSDNHFTSCTYISVFHNLTNLEKFGPPESEFDIYTPSLINILWILLRRV